MVQWYIFAKNMVGSCFTALPLDLSWDMGNEDVDSLLAGGAFLSAFLLSWEDIYFSYRLPANIYDHVHMYFGSVGTTVHRRQGSMSSHWR